MLESLQVYLVFIFAENWAAPLKMDPVLFPCPELKKKKKKTKWHVNASELIKYHIEHCRPTELKDIQTSILGKEFFLQQLWQMITQPKLFRWEFLAL